MRKYIFLILGCCICSFLTSQNKNLEKIKDFYFSTDKNQLIDSLMESSIKQEREIYKLLDIPMDSVIDARIKESASIRSKSKNSIIIFTPKLKDLENYTFKKNIYDFIYIDSTDIEVRYYDKKNRIEIVLTKEDFLNRYEYEKGNDRKYFDRVARLIEKEDYAIWFSDEGIFSHYPDRNYIFLKNDKIYVFRPMEDCIYELNQFVRTIFRNFKCNFL